jgi:dethiobiotin synthetase
MSPVALDLPVVLVVGLRLGCLNQALLSAAAIRASGLKLAGWMASTLQYPVDGSGRQCADLERTAGHAAPLAVLPWSESTAPDPAGARQSSDSRCAPDALADGRSDYELSL